MHSEHLNRRSTLKALLALGGAAIVVPAWNETVEAADTLACVQQTPTVTEGPYWVDEKLFRSDIRTDPNTGAARAGIPLALTINVQNIGNGACAVVPGAYVDIWHCDAKGIYSDEGTYNPGGGTGTVNTSGQKFLRGYQITDGNGQVQFTTIYPGWYSGRTIHIHVRVRTYSGATILSNFVTQIFFDDAVNDTVMATSAYSRTTARDTTNARDMVYQTANKERMLATLSGDNASGYQASISIASALNTPAAAAPAITSGGVANAASGAAGVAPGAWIAIYGSNLSTATRALAASDLINNTIPTSLGGVAVQIDGKDAFIDYVSPGQINALAPADTATGTVSVRVTNAAGSFTSSVNMQAALPGLFVLNQHVRAVRYPDNVVLDGVSAKAGDILALYGTGFGAVSSAPAAGVVFTGAYEIANPVTVTVGGVSAQVLWAGLVGPGLYQLNVVVPAVPSGDQAVVATVSGVGTQPAALLKIA
jgi:uncharacterized protein (TIGR03437 family)